MLAPCHQSLLLALLLRCGPVILASRDHANDQGLAADALSGLRTAGYISASQATNTSSDNFLVAADPLDTSDVVVVVNVPTGTSVPLPGGLPAPAMFQRLHMELFCLRRGRSSVSERFRGDTCSWGQPRNRSRERGG